MTSTINIFRPSNNGKEDPNQSTDDGRQFHADVEVEYKFSTRHTIILYRKMNFFHFALKLVQCEGMGVGVELEKGTTQPFTLTLTFTNQMKHKPNGILFSTLATKFFWATCYLIFFKNLCYK